MKHYVIPEEFFKGLAQKAKTADGKLYSRLWIYWLSEFAEDILQQIDSEIQQKEFLEKQIEAYPKIREIREVYQFGVQLLQQHRFRIEETKGEAKKVDKPVSRAIREDAKKIIDYLNQKSGSTYKAQGKNLELISDRIKEGFTISDFMIVIDKKVYDWKGTEREEYLRPITLFAKSKFENYLNNGAKTNPASSPTKFASSIERAKDLIGLRTD